MAKFDRDKRTLETRLLFIKDLFTNTFEPIDIMAHCIQYKLSKSLEAYANELLKSAWLLKGEDPIEILKKIDK